MTENSNTPQTESGVAPIKQAEPPTLTNVDDTFEGLLRTYEHCQHWITLADTKAGFILTIHGVLTGFLIQYIPKIQQSYDKMHSFEVIAVLGFLGIYFLTQTLSFIYTIQTFFPRQLKVDYQETRHIFPIGLKQAYPSPGDREKFWGDYQKLSESDLKKEYAFQTHTDALICDQKYGSLRKALKSLLVAGVLAFLSFLSINLFVIKYLT